MNGSHANHVTISHDASQEDVDAIRKGLADFDRARTRGGMEHPGIEIDLVLKDPEGQVVGGLNASTMLSVMHLEVLWVAEEHRKLGYGASLVLEAERIGKQKGCITSQTMTFSFQAPEFYQKIGYQVLGVYDGYSSGITESTLMKRLQPQRQTPNSGYQNGEQCEPGGFLITENVTEEEMKVVRDGLGRYVIEHAGSDWDKPGIPIRLVVKDRAGAVVGGLLAWTILRNMILDAVWLHERYRRLGYGKALMLEAERIATENGCLACQTFCFSFHAPEFFRKLGYDAYGIANGYPDPFKEYLLIKRFQGTTALPA